MNHKKIHKLCEKYDITEYNINPDGSIDVYEHVHLYNNTIPKLPFIFNRVDGDFLCNNTTLTTLEGVPRYVAGFFDCSGNELSSLEHFPDFVEGFIDIDGNYFSQCFIEHLDELESAHRKPFIKYYEYYEVFDTVPAVGIYEEYVVLNLDNYNALMKDIKEGLM